MKHSPQPSIYPSPHTCQDAAEHEEREEGQDHDDGEGHPVCLSGVDTLEFLDLYGEVPCH